MNWSGFDYILGGGYFAALLAIGSLASRRNEGSNQFLNATGSLPLWICIAASITANCGSLDVIAMMALGAQYGMLACHFYWIGAIPALVVVAFWFLPAYARGRYPTVLSFIAHCYGERTKAVVALCMAAMMLMLAGVCLCAVAQIITAFLGWNFGMGVIITASVVLFYTWMGGLRATVYTQLLHFAVVLLAIVPLFFLVLRDFGGLRSLIVHIPPDHLHAWKNLPLFAPQATMDLVGVTVGLGVVLSFGFWSTDFVQMQRALAVKRRDKVAFVPLSIATAKIAFAIVVAFPGIVAPLIVGEHLRGNWNMTLPDLMLHYFKHSWVAIGIMGLAASLVSTFANNVSGFSSAFVQGIYQEWICPRMSDTHYFWIGRIANVVAILLSVGAAYSALSYQSLMEYIQMILSTFNAPIFALVALSVLAPRRGASGGLAGLTVGVASAGLHQALVSARVVHYGSRMNTNFYAAIISFGVTTATALIFGGSRKITVASGRAEPEAKLPFTWSAATMAWAAVVCGACLLLNVWFR